MKRPNGFLMAAFAVALSAAAVAVFPHAQPAGAADGQQAHDFALHRSDTGKTLKLSDSNGKVRIVNFWATWCPPCRAEIPSFVSLYGQYKGKGLEIIGVSVDEDGPAAVNPFRKSHHMNYPVVLADQATVEAYGGIRGIPNTFVIDRKGKIVKHYVGAPGPDEAAIKAAFERDIKPLL